jgi:hypothetical protein
MIKVNSKDNDLIFEAYMDKKMSKRKQIKSYNEVKVGDIAFENPDAGGKWDHELGEVLWVGTLQDLKRSPYKQTMIDWLNQCEEDNENPFDEYDLIVINLDGYDGGPTLFNYNNDPSGCVVFK